MIPEADLKKIEPRQRNGLHTSDHVQAGIPIPKSVRIRMFSPDEWEVFIEEWATSLQSIYKRIRRFGGSGDLGVDIAGFVTDHGFEREWDNFQCKRYDHPLRPSDIWVEIGKIIYYSHIGKFTVPRKHYFVGSQGTGTSLEQLLNNSAELKLRARENWDTCCKSHITSTVKISLTGELKDYFDGFDFNIFKSKSHLELIDTHSKTIYHSVRFGGGLPLRPSVERPPLEPTAIESRYIRQILDAYGDHAGQSFPDPSHLEDRELLKRDYLRQRERFYHAEGLRNFARDTVPNGTFESLQDEIYQGVVDISETDHLNGFERMKATISQAAQIACTSNPLTSSTKTQDRQGICHQLANENRLTWIQNHE